jgi:hypothetical protein
MTQRSDEVKSMIAETLEAVETKIDSAGEYPGNSQLRIAIFKAQPWHSGCNSVIYAEAATTEQPTVSKTVSG